MSGHIPAARARHQKYLLARLPRDNADDDGLQHGITSVATITRTIPFPEHTITETEAVPVLVTIALDGAPTLVPIGPPVPIVGPSSPPDQPPQPQPSSSSSPAPTSTAASSDSVASASPSSTASPPTSAPSTPTSNPVDASSSNTSPSAVVSHDLSSSLSSSGPSSTTSAVVPSNSGALDTTGAVTQPKGLSGGAIGGIVIAILILAGVITIYLVRKVFLRRRQNRRISWGAAVYPNFDEKASEKRAPPPAIPNKLIVTSVPGTQSSYNNAAPISPISPPTPMRAGITSPTLVPAAGTPAVPLAPATSSSYGNYAFVRCTFIPNLPDELSITMGEMVCIVTEYDDGWALCQNGPGEQGVVPVECLDRGGTTSITSPGQYLGQGTGDWRMSRRASSLYATQNAGAPHL